jgi:hypothetical protein
MKFFTGENEAIALTETGEIIAHSKYINNTDIPYDFGARGFNNKKHHSTYDAVYPKGWDLSIVYIENIKDIKENSLLEKALKNLANRAIVEEAELV